MPNSTYGGVRGNETKVGQKTFVSQPTRLFIPLFAQTGRGFGLYFYTFFWFTLWKSANIS